jgi:copper(I)-binding protein
MRRRILLLSLAALGLAAPAFGQETRVGDLVITEAWSRAAGRGHNGAAFLTITNRGNRPDQLLSASSPEAGAIQVHESREEGGAMRMRETGPVEIPPGGSVTLRPGGLHIMLMELRQPLQQGGEVPITLRFARAGEVTVPFRVLAAGARGPREGAH